MTNEQKEFREVMDIILGKYTANTIDLYRLSDYIFQAAIDVLKDSDVSKIRDETPKLTDTDKYEFYRALRETSLFTSQRVLLRIISDSSKKLKETIPMCERSLSSGGTSQSINSNNFSTNEAEFEIDTSSIPRVDINTIKSAVDKSIAHEREEKSMSSDFEADIDFSKVQKNKESKFASFANSDISELAEDTYDRIPTIDRGMDY